MAQTSGQSDNFLASPTPTIGMELEAAIVTRGNATPLAIGPELAEACSSGTSGSGVHHEMHATQLELAGEPSGTVHGAVEGLTQVYRTVEPFLEEAQAGLAAMGMHPSIRSAQSPIVRTPHFASIVDLSRWSTRDLFTNSVQFHVGVPGADAAIHALHGLSHHLPVLLSLSASSPVSAATPTGFASTRAWQFARVARSGTHPEVNSWAEHCRMMTAITGTDDVNRHPHAAWWDVMMRPDLGTVEVRICDAIADQQDIAALGALVHCLVVDSLEHPVRPLPWALANENRWRALRDGIQADVIVNTEGSTSRIRDLVENLVNRLRPAAAGLSCEEHLLRCIELAEGNATHQSLLQRWEEGSTAAVVDAMTIRW